MTWFRIKVPILRTIRGFSYAFQGQNPQFYKKVGPTRPRQKPEHPDKPGKPEPKAVKDG